jgi:hypothetical protein
MAGSFESILPRMKKVVVVTEIETSVKVDRISNQLASTVIHRDSQVFGK